MKQKKSLKKNLIKLKDLPIGDKFDDEDGTRYKRISKTKFKIIDTSLDYLGKGYRKEDIIPISKFKRYLESDLDKIGEHLWFLD